MKIFKSSINYYYEIKNYPTITGMVIDNSNDIAYFKNGKYHNAYGPSELIDDDFVRYELEGHYICEVEELTTTNRKKLVKQFKSKADTLK